MAELVTHAEMPGVDIDALQTAFLAVLIAHREPLGMKPTEPQINEISRLSGVAVAAIIQTLSAACVTHAERMN